MRHWAREYVGGLLMEMERKNCWQIAEARKIPAENLKSLQHFLYGSPWPWRPIIDEMARLVDEHLGSDDGIVVVDESGVRRWGTNPSVLRGSTSAAWAKWRTARSACI